MYQQKGKTTQKGAMFRMFHETRFIFCFFPATSHTQMNGGLPRFGGVYTRLGRRSLQLVSLLEILK